MKTTILVLALLLGLTACATKGPAVVLPPASDAKTDQAGAASPATGKPMAKAKTKVDIPEDVLIECPVLPPLESNNPTPKQALEHKAKEVAIYVECQRKNSILVKIVKTAFNIK